MIARLTLILAVVALVSSAGCGPVPQARFVTNQRTQGLMPEARTAVQATLLDNFGTPNRLVAWTKLPVEFGRLEGAASANKPNVERASTFPTDLNGQFPRDAQGMALLWLGGKFKDKQFTVRSYNPETHDLALTSIMEPAPAAGDKFVVVGHNLQLGRKLYMTNCVHCHGVSGDGNGPTARYLNPLPRDYRLGIFKFTSTQQADKASRDDLHRTVKYGIPGTYMPSFLLLKDHEVDAIVEYVRWLAMRGETENRMDAELEGDYSVAALQQRKEQGEKEADINTALATYITKDLPGAVDSAATDLTDVWTKAEEQSQLVVPKQKRNEPNDASLARGRELFLSGKAKCAACHGVTGVGNGPQTEDVQPGFTEPGLFDAWKKPIVPRNLTQGIYRGGRRPIDLFRRVYAGIKGTPMPAFGGTLSDGEIWDLVNYVMSIPFESEHSPADHSKKVATSGEVRHGG